MYWIIMSFTMMQRMCQLFLGKKNGDVSIKWNSVYQEQSRWGGGTEVFRRNPLGVWGAAWAVLRLDPSQLPQTVCVYTHLCKEDKGLGLPWVLCASGTPSLFTPHPVCVHRVPAVCHLSLEKQQGVR